MNARTLRSLLFPLLLPLAACPSSQPQPEPKVVPDDVSCSALHKVSDAQAMADALAAAKAGECVVAAQGRYEGAFTVPAQVTLVAEKGAAVEVVGDDAQAPAVALQAGAAAVDLTIASSRQAGLRVDGLAALGLRLKIDGAATVGLVAWCEEDCGQGDPLASLTDVEVTGSGYGMVVHAARVVMKGGRIAENVGQEVVNGMGAVVSGGGSLELDGTVVEKNRQVGVLVDGAASKASLKGVKVSSNTGRGVWLQGLRGTDAAPAVKLEGCTVEKNSLVGVGARDSQGITITGGRIAETRLSTTIVEGGLTAQVGDGVGLFAGSQAKLSEVELASNGRAQLLVDSGAAGISVQGGKVEPAGAGQSGLVVQRTPGGIDTPFAVTVPPANEELSFSAPNFALPAK